jgi:hypothetical protein
MARKYQNFLSGTLSQPLATTETVLQSPGLSALQVVSSPDHMVLVVNPEGDTVYSTGPEIVHVTSHASGQTVGQVLRGQHGTQSRAHAVNTPWVAAIIDDDWLRIDALAAQLGVVVNDGWVTENRIAAGAVARHKIGASAIAANSGVQLVDGQLATTVDGVTLEQSLTGMRVKKVSTPHYEVGSVDTNALQNLAVTNGKVADSTLTGGKLVDGTVTQLKLATLPELRLRRDAFQSVPGQSGPTTLTAISWDTEDADTNGFWSTGEQITIPTGLGGVYSISMWLKNNSGIQGAGVCPVAFLSIPQMRGAQKTDVLVGNPYEPDSAIVLGSHVSWTGRLDAGDVIRGYVRYAVTGGPFNTYGGFEMYRIGR